MEILNEHIINHITQKGSPEDCIKLELVMQLREINKILNQISGTLRDIEQNMKR